VDGACAALGHATTEFGSHQLKVVTKYPE